jgi:hypothetical protein
MYCFTSSLLTIARELLSTLRLIVSISNAFLSKLQSVLFVANYSPQVRDEFIKAVANMRNTFAQAKVEQINKSLYSKCPMFFMVATQVPGIYVFKTNYKVTGVGREVETLREQNTRGLSEPFFLLF